MGTTERPEIQCKEETILRRDPVVLGKDIVLSGNDIGTERPNDNQLFVGCSGTGKSTSCMLPTMVRMQFSNPIASFAKAGDAYRMAALFRKKGYRIFVLDLSRPARGNVSFDPLMYAASHGDVEELSMTIVNSVLKKSNDDYWNSKARPLLTCLCEAARMHSDSPGKSFGFAEVLKLFDLLIVQDSDFGNGITTCLDSYFAEIEKKDPDCYACREYRSFRSLPPKTASCVRDTLSAALSTVFSQEIRNTMREKPQIDFRRFASSKAGIFVISSVVDSAQDYFMNLFFRTCIRYLLRFAENCPEGRLPRPVRLIFDDFACTSPIEHFEQDISLFRAAGLSAMILLQSETQLEAIYGPDKAAIIRQNCPVYVYFPGGFDERSCELVSKRMNLPYEDVLYAPLGDVFIMQTGRKPVQARRYDIFHSREYMEYQKVPAAMPEYEKKF
jgi:type IV secretory pathway TraG/TraD family ATPase VirD4